MGLIELNSGPASDTKGAQAKSPRPDEVSCALISNQMVVAMHPTKRPSNFSNCLVVAFQENLQALFVLFVVFAGSEHQSPCFTRQNANSSFSPLSSNPLFLADDKDTRFSKGTVDTAVIFVICDCYAHRGRHKWLAVSKTRQFVKAMVHCDVRMPCSYGKLRAPSPQQGENCPEGPRNEKIQYFAPCLKFSSDQPQIQIFNRD